MLRISDTLTISEVHLRVRFVHARGPGGQHVNKAATGVEVRLDVAALPEAVARRLRARFPAHVTGEGEVVVVADGHRSQVQNRREAEVRLVEMVRTCLRAPRPRCRTRVPTRSRRARLAAKRRRGEIKRQRRRPVADEG